MYHSRRRHPTVRKPPSIVNETSDHKYRTLLKEVLDLKRKPHETGHMWRLKQYESLLLSYGAFEGNLNRICYAISLMQNGHYHIRVEKQEYAPVFADTEPAFLRAAQSMMRARPHMNLVDYGLSKDSPDDFDTCYRAPGAHEHIRLHAERLVSTNLVTDCCQFNPTKGFGEPYAVCAWCHDSGQLIRLAAGKLCPLPLICIACEKRAKAICKKQRFLLCATGTGLSDEDSKHNCLLVQTSVMNQPNVKRKRALSRLSGAVTYDRSNIQELAHILKKRRYNI